MNEVLMCVFIIAVIVLGAVMFLVDDKKNNIELVKKEMEEKELKEKQLENSKNYRKNERLQLNEKIKNNLNLKMTNIVPNKKIKVLIADYNSGMISITASALESIGVEIELAKSGYDILDLIEDGNSYDAIITNNIFRDSPDSYQILDQLKEREDFNIPVIVLTVSKNQRYHFVNELGFNEYLEKPLDIEKAQKALCSVIKDLKFNKKEK